MNATISDRRDLGAFIPSILDDFGLDVYSFRIYCRIVRRAGTPKGCFESINSMAKALKIDRKTIIKSLKLLLSHKLIEKETRKGYSSIYHLTPASEWIEWGDPKTEQPPVPNMGHPPCTESGTTPVPETGHPPVPETGQPSKGNNDKGNQLRSSSENDDENKNINFEVQSLETTPQLDTTAETIPNSPLAKKAKIEDKDQGVNTQSDGEGVFAPPCSKNVNSASHKDPLKEAHERRQAYRKKQQSGGFKDEHLADKFSPLFVDQGKVWGKHPQEVFEGFEAFILQKAKDKANPQGYAITVISKTVESFNQGKISEQYLWNEYLKANKPPATEPDPMSYVSAVNLFKTFYNSDMDFARQQIEDVCKKPGWTFERFVEYAHTKGDLLDFSFN